MSEPHIYDKKEYKNLHWSSHEKRKDQIAYSKFEDDKRKELLKLEERRRREELENIRSQGRPFSDRKKKFTTTKVFMYIILLNCMAIEIYSMWVMYKLSDLSALYSLIGAVIGESLSFAIYCAKSFNDSKEEAKAQLERDKFEATFKDNNNNGIPDDEEDLDVVTEDTDSLSVDEADTSDNDIIS